MANDRIYLRCNKCGPKEDICLYKMMGNGLYLDSSIPVSEYADWLERHVGCHPQAYGNDLEGVAGFCVLTESDVEFHLEWKQCPHDEWKVIEETSSPKEDRRVEKCVLCGHRRVFSRMLRS